MAATKKSKVTSGSRQALSTGDRNEMKDSTYAFAAKRKEPLNDASHVRNAISRFDQVKDVTDKEREEAFHNIKAAAKKFGVEIAETSWQQLGGRPHNPGSAHKK